MSDESPVAVVERFLTELFEAENRDVVREVCAEGFRIHDAGRTQTRAELYEGMAASNRAFGKTLTVQDCFAGDENRTVVARFERTYTHRGEYRGMEPTGTEATFTAIMIARVSGGKLEEAWVNTDDLGVMRQLGLVPPASELAAEAAAAGEGGDADGESAVDAEGTSRTARADADGDATRG